jgi:hypothetical protein
MFRRGQMRSLFLLLMTQAFGKAPSFITTTHSYRSFDHRLRQSCDSVDGDMHQLYERLQKMRLGVLEDEFTRPPHAKLHPSEVVRKILEGLLQPYDPLPDAGFRRLLRASTSEWRSKIHHSIGAPDNAKEEAVASALGSAIARPNNQFGILVGAEDTEDYYLSFPSDLLDFEDGSCWLECRLYGKTDNALLVAMGWDFCQRPSDGAWLVDSIDWQDFRDGYRPGIGREEWMRICG